MLGFFFLFLVLTIPVAAIIGVRKPWTPQDYSEELGAFQRFMTMAVQAIPRPKTDAELYREAREMGARDRAMKGKIFRAITKDDAPNAAPKPRYGAVAYSQGPSPIMANMVQSVAPKKPRFGARPYIPNGEVYPG